MAFDVSPSDVGDGIQMTPQRLDKMVVSGSDTPVQMRLQSMGTLIINSGVSCMQSFEFLNTETTG